MPSFQTPIDICRKLSYHSDASWWTHKSASACTQIFEDQHSCTEWECTIWWRMWWVQINQLKVLRALIHTSIFQILENYSKESTHTYKMHCSQTSICILVVLYAYNKVFIPRNLCVLISWQQCTWPTTYLHTVWIITIKLHVRETISITVSTTHIAITNKWSSTLIYNNKQTIISYVCILLISNLFYFKV